MAKGPCREDQIKKFPWTPKQTASLLKYAQEKFPHADLVDTVKGLAADLGRSEKFILEGLTKPAGISRRATTEMWLKQQQRRNLQAAARQSMHQINRPGWSKALEKAYQFPRTVAVIGHWTVFPKTHGGDYFLTNPGLWLKVWGRSARVITKTGKAAHEQRITNMKLHENYPEALRSGLDVAPGGEGAATFRGEAREIFGKEKVTPSSMAFDELRIGRFELFNRAIKNLSKEERADTAGMKMIADSINHPTGAAKSMGSWAKWLLFAPRLLPATFKAAFIDPVRAAKIGVKAATGGKFTAAERIAAKGIGKRLGILYGVQGGALALNAAYAKLSGDKEYMPNLTDPGLATWLRPKIAGYSIPVSPTTEMQKVAVRAGTRAIHAPSGQGIAEASKVVGRFLVGKENPLLGFAWEALLGEQAYGGRPLPEGVPSVKSVVTGKPSKPSEARPQLTYSELAGTKLPIFMSNYVAELYDGMRESGLEHPDAKAIIRSLIVGTIAGPTGLHIHKTHEKGEHPERKSIEELMRERAGNGAKSIEALMRERTFSR